MIEMDIPLPALILAGRATQNQLFDGLPTAFI